MSTPTVTHKNYGDRGPVVNPDKLTPYETEEKFNPQEHGGILQRLGKKALMPRSYRPGQEALVHEKDIQELNLGKADRIFHSPEAMLAELSGTGSEFEFHVSKVRRRTGRHKKIYHALCCTAWRCLGLDYRPQKQICCTARR